MAVNIANTVWNAAVFTDFSYFFLTFHANAGAQ